MDRIAKYGAIAKQNDLDRDKFDRAKEETDRQWSVTTGNVAEQFGLNANKFRTEKFHLDNQINSLFFDKDLSQEELAAKTEELVTTFSAKFADPGAALRANDLFDATFGAAQRQTAIALGLDADRYQRASRQADLQEEQAMEAWASFFESSAMEDPMEEIDFGENSQWQGVHSSLTEALIDFGESTGMGTDDEFAIDAWLRSIDVDEGESGFNFESGERILAALRENSPEVIEDMRLKVNNSLSQVFFTPAQFNVFFKEWWRSRKAGDAGNVPGGGVIIEKGFLRATRRDWITHLDKESMQLFGAIYNSQSISPERGGGESSFLGGVSKLIGTVGGAYIGYTYGGGPKGMIEGAKLGYEVAP
jgi:hypothetical protein